MAKALEYQRKKLTPLVQLVSTDSASYLEAKILKSGPLRLRFQHSGAKITVFEQNTEIINFGIFGSFFPTKSRKQVHVK